MYADKVLTGACVQAGGATAIIASQADPLPPWAGFSFIPVMLVAPQLDRLSLHFL